MNRILRGERGMISIFGLCALGILMIISAAMYTVSKNHISSARRFLVRDALRNAAEDGVRLATARMNSDAATAMKGEPPNSAPAIMAEDGVRLAVARMNTDVDIAMQANGATAKKKSLLTTKVGDASVEVFARKKETEILLLGVGKKEREEAEKDSARVVGVVKENAGKYVIERWER